VGVLLNQEKRESEDYWLGVRDALRMIDSFVKWSKRNPQRAKNLEHFISDGLIAAAKRCKSCLSDELGVKFVDEDEEELEIEGSPISDEIPLEFDESSEEKSPQFEDTPLSDAMGYNSQVAVDVSESTEILSDERSTDFESTPSTEMHDEEKVEFSETESSGVSRDELEHSSDSMTDIDLESESRDFSSDYDVAEPEPLVISDEPDEIKSEEHTEASDEFTFDSDIDSPPSPLSEDDYEDESDIDLDAPPAPPDDPAFTWREYEETLESTHDSDISATQSEKEKSSWSSYDEPVSDDIDELESEETSDDSTDESPPSPPAPESDESEEERRRRARRLFFGT
jgi:hypothetical protein